jgi:hypothetical protein
VQWGDIRGTVIALDPVEARVTIRHGVDLPTVIPLRDIAGE